MTPRTSGYERTPGGWDWPEYLLPEVPTEKEPLSGHPPEHELPKAAAPTQPQEPKQETPKPQKKERHYRPRTCRICLETVLPTFHPPSDNLPNVLQGSPSVSYESESGRLISPCKCKGSSRYVHESCLQEWRHADPSYGRRNYWNCPTCGYQYRIGRLSWGHWLSSTATQIVLTLVIFSFAVFALGFVADPIINLYLDPVGTVTSGSTSSLGGFDEYYYEDEEVGWAEHFLKGFASLGLVGFIKVFLTMGPWNWFNMRQFMSSGGAVRTGNTGRDRVANISWIVMIVGIMTFLFTVWKGVRAWSRRVLEKASERVMDIGDGGIDDDDEDDT